jgi:hypothetical protein
MEELRSLLRGVSEVGVTYSQLVSTVTDVLYTGYTNVSVGPWAGALCVWCEALGWHRVLCEGAVPPPLW